MSIDDRDFFIQESFRLRFDMMQKDINRLRNRIARIEKAFQILLTGLDRTDIDVDSVR